MRARPALFRDAPHIANAILMGFKQAFLKCIVFDPNQYALAGLHLLVMKFHGDPVESLSSDSQFVR